MPLVFQYGSNCLTERLNGPQRLGGAAVVVGRAQTVDEYDIAFDVWSQGNGSAASDLVLARGTGHRASGVLYEIPLDRIRGKKRPDGLKTLEEIEGPRYEQKPIRVRKDRDEEVDVTTFLVKGGECRPCLWTSADYVGHIVKGLRDHGVEEEDPAYIQHIIDAAILVNQAAKDSERAEQQNRLIESFRNPTKTDRS